MNCELPLAWYGCDPVGVPPPFRCRPGIWHPYIVPPVIVHAFQIQVVHPPVVVPGVLPVLVERQQNTRPAEADERPSKAVVRSAKARDPLDLRAEMQRLLRKGNDAFAAGNYQEALAQYQQAVAKAPLEPMPYFHLAQAHLALGRLAEAGVAIERGMRLHAHWPKAPFQPRALYRDNAGDYERHLGVLAEEVARNMNDEALLFLLGYQLWFDGRREEALVLLRRAGALAHDTTLVDRFLAAAQPAGN
jgi:tetratricopeptide (TPR) repeat protein